MGAPELLRLRLPASVVFVSVAREAVVSLARGLGFDQDSRDALRLAVGEACNNAVEHGGPRAVLSLRCLQEEGFFVAEVANTGGAFVPAGSAAMPDGNAEHGRGRALMETLMDAVEYETQGSDTLVRLKKRLPEALPTD